MTAPKPSAAAEKVEAALIADMVHPVFPGPIADALTAFAAEAVAAEREACAKICMAHVKEWHGQGMVAYHKASSGKDLAKAIRARGSKDHNKLSGK